MGQMRSLMGLLGAASALMAAIGFAEQDRSADTVKDFRRQRAWEISNAKVSGSGSVTRMPQGSLIDRITVEGDARSKEGATALNGKFTLILSLFAPAQNMTGQKKGHWYVRGDWTISDPEVPPEQLRYRHTPAVVKGTMTADLAFNPLKTAGRINGAVRLTSGKKGSFSGNERFEGSLKFAP